MNIGETIDFLYEKKKEKSKLNQQIKEIDEATTEKEQELIQLIRDQGVNGLHSDIASASISEETYGSIEDYEAFERHIIDTNSLFLLQRRVAQPAVKDLLAAGEEVPGIKLFTKTKLSLRKR